MVSPEHEKEIVRKYLNHSDLKSISRKVKLDTRSVLGVLFNNSATRDSIEKEYERYKSGEFSSFFHESKLGRPKLSEEKTRKIRQVRISDEEMEILGNPSSTQIRNRLFTLEKIVEFCKVLDQKGIKIIPDEWLSADYNKNDPFWNNAVYQSNFSRLTSVSEIKNINEKIPNKEDAR